MTTNIISMIRPIIFIAIAVGLYWGLKWFYGKRDGTASDMPNNVFFWIAMVFALGLLFGTPYLGTKIPGSFFERSEYQGMFYVNLFPDGQKVKSYRVLAMVSKNIESDTDYDGRSNSRSEYRIEFVVMPNGGKVTFYDSSYEHPLELGRIVTMSDDNEREWGIELTNHPVMK